MPINSQGKRPLYIFLDESGDFNFSPTGTKIFIMSAMSTFRPFPWYQDLIDLKFELLEKPHSLELERFHASENLQWVRDRVFAILSKYQDHLRVDSVYFQKNKAFQSLRTPETIYPLAVKTLLEWAIRKQDFDQISEAIFIMDTLPPSKSRPIIKSIKLGLSATWGDRLKYSIHCWDSRATIGLQAVDYFNWAIFRKHNQDDLRSYNLIKSSVKSEFDIWRFGGKVFY